MEHIVKRKGHKERYDERKVYASIFAACMSLRMSDEEAETISHIVSEGVSKEFGNVHEISAHAIHKFVSDSLKKHNKDVAYMYETHRDIL